MQKWCTCSKLLSTRTLMASGEGGKWDANWTKNLEDF